MKRSGVAMAMAMGLLGGCGVAAEPGPTEGCAGGKCDDGDEATIACAMQTTTGEETRSVVQEWGGDRLVRQDVDGLVIVYEYAGGRLAGAVTRWRDGPPTGTQTWEYDPEGRLALSVRTEGDAAGVPSSAMVISYPSPDVVREETDWVAYNGEGVDDVWVKRREDGRTVEWQNDAHADGEFEYVVRWEYEGGRVVRTLGGWGEGPSVRRLEYDAEGRLVRAEGRDEGGAVYNVETFEHGWDSVRRRSEWLAAYPSTQITDVTFHENGRVATARRRETDELPETMDLEETAWSYDACYRMTTGSMTELLGPYTTDGRLWIDGGAPGVMAPLGLVP